MKRFAPLLLIAALGLGASLLFGHECNTDVQTHSFKAVIMPEDFAEVPVVLNGKKAKAIMLRIEMDQYDSAIRLMLRNSKNAIVWDEYVAHAQCPDY